MTDEKLDATETPGATETPTEPHEASGEQSYEGPPVGAIAVTTFLTVVILLVWFGMYFLNIARG